MCLANSKKFKSYPPTRPVAVPGCDAGAAFATTGRLGRVRSVDGSEGYRRARYADAARRTLAAAHAAAEHRAQPAALPPTCTPGPSGWPARR